MKHAGDEKLVECPKHKFGILSIATISRGIYLTKHKIKPIDIVENSTIL
jgi:hypothetical protein